jgi:hypothetical protein
MRPQNPRGIRNFNPGNIRHAQGVRWQGQADAQTDSEFVQFNGPRWGIRAPPNENDTASYVATVSRVLGVGPDDGVVDVYNFETMRDLVVAIIRHENGPGSLPGGAWYGDAIIADGLQLAGIVRGVQHGKTAGAQA